MRKQALNTKIYEFQAEKVGRKRGQTFVDTNQYFFSKHAAREAGISEGFNELRPERNAQNILKFLELGRDEYESGGGNKTHIVDINQNT